MGCLIVFRSMTQTQYAASILRHKQVRVMIVRPPLHVGKGSCSAALQLADKDLLLAASLFDKLSFRPLAYYCMASDGTLQEVFP